jgi:phosphate transport system protein
MENHPKVCVEISNDQLFEMGQIVEKAVARSIKALLEFDAVTARFVIEEDKTINSYEIDIDNSTFNILAIDATGMPSDALRLILSIQRINPMLERIGDHAVNIAESAETIARQAKGCNLFSLASMADHCKKILRDAIASFFNKNETLAEDVLRRDEAVDELNLSITAAVKACIMSGQDALSFDTALEIIRVCKNLERIADLASNIAEEAMFSMIGKVVKHHAAG